MFLDETQIDELDTLDFLVECAATKLVVDSAKMQAWMTEDETGILDVHIMTGAGKLTLEQALLDTLAHNPHLRHLREALIEALTNSKQFRQQALDAVAQQIEEDKTDVRR